MSKHFETSRLEDMSPDGKLSLTRQPDGDIILEITQGDDDGLDSEPGRRVSVEFCTYVGGGGSHRTLLALKNLMIAMAQDNIDQHGRRPDRLENQEAIAAWATVVQSQLDSQTSRET